MNLFRSARAEGAPHPQFPHRLPEAVPARVFALDGVSDSRHLAERQAALLAKAEHSLAAAELLAAAGWSDISVSRAYFAMYYAATALLLDHEVTAHRHGALTLALGREFVDHGLLPVEACDWLIEANDARLDVDYSEQTAVTVLQAATHRTRAAQFVAAARTLIDTAPPKG